MEFMDCYLESLAKAIRYLNPKKITKNTFVVLKSNFLSAYLGTMDTSAKSSTSTKIVS